MMEYCDDVRHFEGHGHASCDAYAMATSLASDIAHHLRQVPSFSHEGCESANVCIF